jgi:hypothetical protein
VIRVPDRLPWRRRDELHGGRSCWIEHTYSRRRCQHSLGKLTPVKYELASTAHDTAHADPAAVRVPVLFVSGARDPIAVPAMFDELTPRHRHVRCVEAGAGDRHLPIAHPRWSPP